VHCYFVFLGRSIERGTQLVVFEPNGYVLWDNVRAPGRSGPRCGIQMHRENASLDTLPEEVWGRTHQWFHCELTTQARNEKRGGRRCSRSVLSRSFPPSHRRWSVHSIDAILKSLCFRYHWQL
jgi:hypothetical protein